MLKININNSEYDVAYKQNDKNKGTINKKDFELNLIKISDVSYHLLKDNKSYNIDILSIDYSEKKIDLRINGISFSGKAFSEMDLLLKEMGIDNFSSKKTKELKAPMPGLVLDINVKVGDEVKEGDKLIVLEAMKMENNLKAESDAVIKSINCSKSKAVEKNEILIVFE